MGTTRRSALASAGLAALGLAGARGEARAAADDVPGAAGGSPSAPAEPAIREHWIACIGHRRVLTPTGRDAWTGRRVGRKVLDGLCYVETTPGFKRPLRARGVGDNAGMPGPVLRAYPQDQLVVHFRNLDPARMPHTMHPHGVHYYTPFDGTAMGAFTPPGGAVEHGDTFTYQWDVRDESVGVWPYHDHGPHEMDGTARGLFGAIVVRPRDEAPPDVEHTVFLHTADTGDDVLSCVNGRAFPGNTPTLESRLGARVALNVLTLGDDLHSFHVHAHRWRDEAGAPVDTSLVAPGQGLRISYVEDAQPGRYLYHCHMAMHMMRGMAGWYVVRGA